jgi:O-6-methylguanine DNA methyltransferase
MKKTKKYCVLKFSEYGFYPVVTCFKGKITGVKISRKKPVGIETCDNFKPGKIDFDSASLSGFGKKTLKALKEKVPSGKVTTYSRLAAMAGSPGACRAIGTIMAKNPFPILVPCHRVIKSDMTPGEYGPGKDIKKLLLGLEKIKFSGNGRISPHTLALY